MINNMQKTKEIVFHRPSPKKICLPSTVDTDSIEQVASAKLLGVITITFTLYYIFIQLLIFIIVFIQFGGILLVLIRFSFTKSCWF